MGSNRLPWKRQQRSGLRERANEDGVQAVNFGYERVDEDEKRRLVREHFTRVARTYDRMNTVLSFGIHYLWKRKAVKLMGLGPGDRVIDVCGGTGDLAILAARRVGPSGRVVVVDFNPDMMQVGKEKFARDDAGKRIEFVEGDAQAIEFPDASFNAAMVGFGIRNVPHMDRGFSEMARVLAPGGVLMCLEFSQPKNAVFRALYDFYSLHVMPWVAQLVGRVGPSYRHLTESIRMYPPPEEVCTLLEELGLEQVRFQRLTNGIATIHLARKPMR